MAYFNEDNVTEQMCIEIAKQAGYQYCGADELREAKNDVIVEPLLQEALIKINHITLAEAQIVILNEPLGTKVIGFIEIAKLF